MNFQRKEELYVLEFDKRPKTVRVGEIDIPMPKMPAESSMVNYGIPVKDQKFVRRPVPKDIKFWEQEDVDDYVAAEWHRRRNGYWILIKGKPFYIPGAADLFFNFWTIELGGLPEFRMGALEWWWFWFNCERDPDCFGMLDIKCRRVGDTENAICAVWERSTRYKNYDGGIIHIKEDGAMKNYNRLVKGNNGMPFFYRPINSGTTKAKGGELDFSTPEERITMKKLKEGGFHEEVETGLGSKIYIEAAVTGAFDGVRLGTYYSDEIFKVKSSKFNVPRQWKVIKPVLSLKNDTWIVGKAIKTSTVEEMEDGETVETAQKLWDESDPGSRMPDGRTVSGLYRYFRGFECAADVDEYGFHQIDEARKIRDGKIAYLRKHKKWEDLLSLFRKQPATIQEALSVPLGDCILYPEMCEERLRQLNEGIDRNGKRVLGRGEYGDLIWKNNVFGGDVVWVPNPAGKCFISQHPDVPNRKIIVNGKAYPGNMAWGRIGCDPFDSDETSETGSDGAFYVKRLLNLAAEPNEILQDENGEILNPEDMMTNQCVCDYTDRPDSPYDFYDYVYRACVYYGLAVFPETDKPGLRTWMKKMGLIHYLQVPPEEIIAASSRKKDPRGITSTPSNISQYIDSLKLHIHKFVWCCHHPRVLENWKRFTKKKRTKFDLTVASGFAELAEFDTRYQKQEEKTDRWESAPFEMYEINEN